MRKQLKRIVKKVVAYRLGLLPVRSATICREGFYIRYQRYGFHFYWPEGKPYGKFQVLTIDKITTWELTHASDYTKYAEVNKNYINLLFETTTDNARPILRLVEETLFPSI